MEQHVPAQSCGVIARVTARVVVVGDRGKERGFKLVVETDRCSSGPRGCSRSGSAVWMDGSAASDCTQAVWDDVVVLLASTMRELSRTRFSVVGLLGKPPGQWQSAAEQKTCKQHVIIMLYMYVYGFIHASSTCVHVCMYTRASAHTMTAKALWSEKGTIDKRVGAE